MKRIFKIEILGSIASIVALAFFVFYQFVIKENMELEVNTINIEKLTETPSDQNLTVNYMFKGREVRNLYKIRFLIRNSGSKTIIGEGNQKNIIGDNIPIAVDSSSKSILFIEKINSNFPNILITDSLKNMEVKFKQWRTNEFIEIAAYIESDNNKEIQNFKIDERDLIDGIVIYTKYSPTENLKERKLIDLFPEKLKKVIWWCAIFAYIILFIVSIYSARKEIMKPELDGFFIKLIFFLVWGFLTFFAMAPFLWMIKI